MEKSTEDDDVDPLDAYMQVCPRNEPMFCFFLNVRCRLLLSDLSRDYKQLRLFIDRDSMYLEFFGYMSFFSVY